MKVVGLSGSHGGGKSTLLRELQQRGWQVDDFRVSRAVQQQLGWDSLQRVLDSPETMKQFQDEVFRQKLERDTKLKMEEPSNIIILTERTFADIWAYTSKWTWTFYERGEMTFDECIQFMITFTAKCVDAQNSIYSGILLLPLMNHIQWEDDTHRASKQDAVEFFADVELFVRRKMPIDTKSLVITGETVEERALQAQVFLESI